MTNAERFWSLEQSGWLQTEVAVSYIFYREQWYLLSLREILHDIRAAQRARQL